MYFTRLEAMVLLDGQPRLTRPAVGSLLYDVNGAEVRGRYLELDPPIGWSSRGAFTTLTPCLPARAQWR